MKHRHALPPALTRGLYRLGASLFLLLGLIGVVVPLMPTTVFLLLSVWCLLRLGDHRAEWLLKHPRLGPPLRLFIEQGAIARRGKLAALGGLSLGSGLLLFMAGNHPWLAGGGIGAMALVALYLVTRPEPARPQAVRM
ncbi:YbaN family protein [Niveispirillum sp.]|uniref:YbaN family protein n=1 Tax=Niveispirillum sp. TaxID=1917217 RepID=UPI001B58FAB1|nr:YbaN family protein [Niveispirillum sp.]MBP7339907.1 YbaN family protein [Niveispirillum sp.]